MQEGREVQGKSGTRIKMTLYNYSRMMKERSVECPAPELETSRSLIMIQS